MINRKPLWDCEIEYVPSKHLGQIYSGFFNLQKKGVINLKVKPRLENKSTPIITAIINKKYKVIYDTLDGLNWVSGNRAANLTYFQNNFDADFYFKRSFHKDLELYKPQNCTVLPLGLNYFIMPSANLLPLIPSVIDKVKYIASSNKYVQHLFKKNYYYASDFEYYPTLENENRILFTTRLWNPDDATSEIAKIDREKINEIRIQCIEICRKEFGKLFTGGVSMDEFSTSKYKSYVLPKEYTGKDFFIDSVKKHSICVATTGLYDSIGWKMGEYVAASRAIVSEPLQYELPGNFKKEQNYLEFTTPHELVDQINRLLSDRTLLTEMMKANFDYYNNYLKPENLVLNTLLQVIGSKILV